MQGSRRRLDTQVLIIGNGPAGLALSAFLSGVQPFYNVDQPHQNELIHERLSADPHLSLLEQDLTWSDQLTDLTSASRPLSILYDMLVRPGVDTGDPRPSSLQWEMNLAHEIPHMVIGETSIGGSWNNYDPEMLAVSFAQSLDLPGYSTTEWLGGTPLVPRLPSCAIASYMASYAEQLGIQRNFHCNMKITSVKKVDDVWVTEGRSTLDNRPFTICSRYVVLACGKTAPRKLGLVGEETCKNIVYDTKTFKDRLASDTNLGKEYTIPAISSSSKAVVVLGDGISSADVVRHCLEREIPVIHVMRRTDRQLRNTMISRLSPTYYGEYNKVHQMMIGRQVDPLYTRMTSAEVVDVNEKTVLISSTKGKIDIPYSLLAVCFGRQSDFDTVLQGKYSFLQYHSEEDPTLFAAGSFAGDHFVRYLVGGCLHVAKEIKAKHRAQQLNNNNNEASTLRRKNRCCCTRMMILRGIAFG
ncbi:unnamed protein product [Caenorhabditis auriculariae]|uniref:FAD/NAD(P)-binding domain-containing protein n=1 Tax=Caenorhabditis auriculariae TaxID=2777116 RepID=A0A8S1HMM5_9PELO|nr:unnamed protein product [Caenorhabditis auriculariae]